MQTKTDSISSMTSKPKPEPGLIVSEIFGPTIQGEGPSRGQPAIFLRLGICNLKCVWCDTKYTWDWTQYNPEEELERVSPEEVEHRILRKTGFQLSDAKPRLLVVTGGEPMLQQDKLYDVLCRLQLAFPKVEIETAGTIMPKDSYWWKHPRVSFNVSPKLSHSGNPREMAFKPLVLDWFNRNNQAVFKYVCQHRSDLDEVIEQIEEVGIPRRKVWIMPEGSREAILSSQREVINRAVVMGLNITLRDHCLIWGDKKGV